MEFTVSHHITSPLNSDDPQFGFRADLIVTDHAIVRLRERFPITNRWSRHRCVRWVIQQIAASAFVIARANGRKYVAARLWGQPCYLAIRPDSSQSFQVVHTVLPPDFAANNLNRPRRRR